MSGYGDAVWRTERWFIARGVPQLIEGYGFRQIVSRMVLGLVVVYPSIAGQWIDGPVAYSRWLPAAPLAMVKLAALLAGFGGLSFVVNSMSDPEDRAEFFAPSVAELERLLAVHTGYLALRGPVHDVIAEDMSPVSGGQGGR